MDEFIAAQFITHFGRPFSTADMSEPAADLFNVLPDIVHSALSSALWPENAGFRPYRFDVGYIDDGSFNAASVDVCPGHGLVAFCAGMPLMLLEAVLQIARQMDSATALPRADAAGRLIVNPERKHLVASANSRGTIAARMSALLDGQQVDKVPFETMALAVLMYDMCARFIAMHECMHIGLGHTAYVRRELGIDVLQEFKRGGSRRLEPSFSQTLEFIADRHTIHGVLNHYLTCDDSFGSRSTALRGAQVPEPIFVMRTLIAALVTLMHLFPVRNRSLTQRTASHPHPYLRARWLCRELMTKLDEEQSLEGIARPFAHWVACIGSNFVVANNWLAASTLDTESMQLGPGKSLTDASYSESIRQAHKWQTLLWKQYSPIYPGDGREISP